MDYTNGEDFTPVLDGTFVPFMLKTMRQLARCTDCCSRRRNARTRPDGRRCNEISLHWISRPENASPLSACALGASVFEDNQLVDEKISLIRPPECVASSTGAMSASTTSRRRWSRTHRRSPRCGSRSPTSRRQRHRVPQRYVRYECALQLPGALRTENARMQVLMHGKGVQAGMA